MTCQKEIVNECGYRETSLQKHLLDTFITSKLIQNRLTDEGNLTFDHEVKIAGNLYNRDLMEEHFRVTKHPTNIINRQDATATCIPEDENSKASTNISSTNVSLVHMEVGTDTDLRGTNSDTPGTQSTAKSTEPLILLGPFKEP
jgi:hypothetical protein